MPTPPSSNLEQMMSNEHGFALPEGDLGDISQASSSQSVSQLTKEEQLEKVVDILDTMATGVLTNNTVAFDAWTYLAENELWRITHESLDDFQRSLGWHEDLFPVID